ncbi:glycosyltransferase [Mesorhizobium marinum]|uniref:Glycosyltransferase n=1 Tax=Mesorhizobium marinum TaxID=3228790 RepID=A0ABV3R097_9HYPH
MAFLEGFELIYPTLVFVVETLGVKALHSEDVVQTLLFAGKHGRAAETTGGGQPKMVLIAADGDIAGRDLICERVPDLGSRGVAFVAVAEPETPALGHPEHQRVYAVFEMLKRGEPAEIHFQDAGGYGYYLTLAKRCGIHFQKTTLVAHVTGGVLFSLEAQDALVNEERSLMLDVFECGSTRDADAVVVHDRRAWDWYRSRLPSLPQQVIDIAWGAASPTRPAAAAPLAEPKPARIVFLGALGQESRLRNFCDAMSLLARERPFPFEVAFVGEAGKVGSVDAVSYIRIRAQTWKVPIRIERNLDLFEEVELAADPGNVVVCDVSRRESLRARLFASFGVPFALIGRDMTVSDDETPRAIVARISEILASASSAIARPRPATSWADGRQWTIAPVRSAPLEAPAVAPLVSVVVTHFSRPQKLRFALESLRRQDYANFEVIVVDDGSPEEAVALELDAIEKEIEPLGWRLVRQANRYLGAARNKGAALARGDYLLFMDDDNCARPDELSKLVSVAVRLDAEVVTPFYHGFEDEEDVARDRPTVCYAPVGGDLAFAVFSPALGDANALYSTDLFRRIGGFSEDYGITHEDWELHIRADLAGARRVTLPLPLFWYRIDQGGMYRNQLMQMHRNANLRRHIRPYLDALPHYQAKLVQYAQGLSVLRQQATGAGANAEAQNILRHASGSRPFARVAIVVRTKDRPVMLQRALRDILAQTYKDWIAVVVNDGGEVDALDLVLEQFAEDLSDRLIVLNNAVSLGMQTASNLGIDACDSDFIVIHDDDDTWDASFLSRTVECMDSEGWNPRVAGVVTWSDVIVEQFIDGYDIVEVDRFVFNDRLHAISLVDLGIENRFPPISFLFRRAAFDDVGHFREEFGVLGDWDFHLRILERFDIRVIPEPLAGYHHRPEATSGAYGNSVHAQRDIHVAKRKELVNSFVRREGGGTSGSVGQLLLQGQFYKNLEYDQNERFQKLHNQIWEVEQRMIQQMSERSGKGRFSLARWLPGSGSGNLVENGDFREWPGPRDVFAVKALSTGIVCPGLLVTFDGREKTYALDRMTSDGTIGLPRGKTYLRVVNKGQASTEKRFWLEFPIEDADAIAGRKFTVSGKARLRGVYEWMSVGGRIDLPDRTRITLPEQKVFLSDDFQSWACTLDCPRLDPVDDAGALARVYLKVPYSEEFVLELTDMQAEVGEHPTKFRYRSGSSSPRQIAKQERVREGSTRRDRAQPQTRRSSTSR